jgi:hypothetical protein
MLNIYNFKEFFFPLFVVYRDITDVEVGGEASMPRLSLVAAVEMITKHRPSREHHNIKIDKRQHVGSKNELPMY